MKTLYLQLQLCLCLHFHTLIVSAVPVGISTLESSRNLALQNENEDLQYCGHTYIMAVLDSDYDLMEPSRHDHILTAETVFICPNGICNKN